MAILTQPETRWSCRACGACCRGFSFGPVEPEIIAGLKDKDIAAQWPPAQTGPWYEERDGQAFLTHRDGHCVFLDEHNLCVVHRLLGAEAKPWFCREYPMLGVHDGADVRVVPRADCGGWHLSFRDGEALEPQAAEAMALPRPVARPDLGTDDVVLLPGAAISMAQWRALAPQLLRQIPVDSPPEATVARIRDLVFRVAGRAVPDAANADVWPSLMKLVSATGPLQPLTEADHAYFNVVLTNDLFAGRFRSIGGVPAMLGLHLLETRTARMSLESIGSAHAAIRRKLLVPEQWQQVVKHRSQLEQLFLDPSV